MIGDARPSDEQKRLYRAAYEQIQHNASLLEPGMSFLEITEKSQRLAPEY